MKKEVDFSKEEIDFYTTNNYSSLCMSNWQSKNLVIGINNVTTINLSTGEVTLTGSPNDAANDFWAAVELMCPRNRP